MLGPSKLFTLRWLMRTNPLEHLSEPVIETDIELVIVGFVGYEGLKVVRAGSVWIRQLIQHLGRKTGHRNRCSGFVYRARKGIANIDTQNSLALRQGWKR